jgi:hypothetical protein
MTTNKMTFDLWLNQAAITLKQVENFTGMRLRNIIFPQMLPPFSEL